MARHNYYTKPEYSKREVNKAAEIYVSDNSTSQEKEQALIIINNWRASHSFPLNIFQKRLRRMVSTINTESLVAQRVKRLISIKNKLIRFPKMNLAQMQDLGGCRAIMKDISEVDALVDYYKHQKSRGVKHKIDWEKDYIADPKPSGYRGVHLIYKYKSDKGSVYEDMRIEIQIRTKMQHAWATAVETVGLFIQQSLKSSQGEDEWLRFFSFMSSAIAIKEGKPIVPNTTENVKDLVDEIKRLSIILDVEGHLKTFRESMEVMDYIKTKDAHYYLLELDLLKKRVTVKTYSATQFETASRDYTTLEKRIFNENKDVVLVSADSIEALKLAFPNYYLDTDYFLSLLKEITDIPNTGEQLSFF